MQLSATNFLMQGLGVRQNKRLGGVINGHVRSSLERCCRRYIEHTARIAGQHAGKQQAREMDQRGDIGLNHVQLALGIELGVKTHQAEAGVVDQNVNVKTPTVQLLCDGAGCLWVRQIGLKHLHRNLVLCLQFLSQCLQRFAPASQQHQTVTCCANSLANSMPMPDEAPVTNTVCLTIGTSLCVDG